MVKWGILGTGKIAGRFAEALKKVKNAELIAVGSRNKETTNIFGQKHQIPLCFKTYNELVSCPDVDVIYVATPHTMHYENTLLCLNEGKHVLCEKPFAVNQNEAKEMIAVAKKSNLFLMEAMWTFFLPFYSKLKEIVQNKEISDVTQVNISCGFDVSSFDSNSKKRYFEPSLYGGIFMDMGIYPVAFANDLFGTPKKISGSAKFHKTNVDEKIDISIKYQNTSVDITCSLMENLNNEVDIIGTLGKIKVCKTWWHCQKLLIETNNQEKREINLPYLYNGYIHEAQAVTDSILNGSTENKTMTLENTLANIIVMDKIREVVGLTFQQGKTD